MKKIFLLGLMCLMGFMGAQAQFSDYGVKLGVGMATIEDDLSTKSPVLGLNAGGYINFTFAQSESVLAEIFYLQTGLNIIHRGSNFEEIHEHENDLIKREKAVKKAKKEALEAKKKAEEEAKAKAEAEAAAQAAAEAEAAAQAAAAQEQQAWVDPNYQEPVYYEEPVYQDPTYDQTYQDQGYYEQPVENQG